MKISCEIIKDLLPLYFDGVCSGDSRAAVDEHIAACGNCGAELREMRRALPVINSEKENLKEAEAVMNLSKRLTREKIKAVLKACLITAAAIAAALIIIYIFVDIRIV